MAIPTLDGELTDKRLHKEGTTKLLPEKLSFETIPIISETDSTIWGVMTNINHRVWNVIVI